MAIRSPDDPGHRRHRGNRPGGAVPPRRQVGKLDAADEPLHSRRTGARALHHPCREPPDPGAALSRRVRTVSSPGNPRPTSTTSRGCPLASTGRDAGSPHPSSTSRSWSTRVSSFDILTSTQRSRGSVKKGGWRKAVPSTAGTVNGRIRSRSAGSPGRKRGCGGSLVPEVPRPSRRAEPGGVHGLSPLRQLQTEPLGQEVVDLSTRTHGVDVQLDRLDVGPAFTEQAGPSISMRNGTLIRPSGPGAPGAARAAIGRLPLPCRWSAGWPSDPGGRGADASGADR